MKKELYCYIHIPFCDLKCNYCRFASIGSLQVEKIKTYVNYLITEIRNKNSLVKKRDFFDDKLLKSIYFGGGTPSVLNLSQIGNILDSLKTEFIFDKNIEIILETTANNIVLENLVGWKKLGINRLSIGVQTLNELSLKTINRGNKGGILQALDLLKGDYFENVSLDFIIGLPYVKVGEIKKDIEFLLSKYDFIKHISVYMLEEYYNPDKIIQNKFDNIVYPEFWKNIGLDESLYLKEYNEIVDFLKEKGFFRYEISNFAKPNFDCKHNKSYWNHSEVASFGLSASGFLQGNRYTNNDDFKKYYDNKKLFEEKITKNDFFLEKLMFDLRTSGIDLDMIKKLNKQKLDYFIGNGYLSYFEDKIILENKGILIMDYILSEII